MQRLLVALPIMLLLVGLALGVAYFVAAGNHSVPTPVVSAEQFDSQPLHAELSQNSPLAVPGVQKPAPEPDPAPEKKQLDPKPEKQQPRLNNELLPPGISDELEAALEKSDLSDADKQARLQDVKAALETLQQKVEEQGITISGHVYDYAGLPLAGASVYVQAETGTRSRRMSRAPASRSVAVSAEDGSYTAQYMPGTDSVIDAKLYAQDQYKLKSPVQEMKLTPGQTYENIDFSVPQGAGVSGRVVDQNYAPVAGARVVASNSEAQKSRGLSRGYAAVTDENGEFTIRGLSAGEFIVSAQGVGYVPQSKPVTINVIEGDPISLGADLVLQTVTSIKLKLVCADSKPSGWATVYCYDREGKQSKLAANCDSQGECVIANVPENTVEIAVSLRGFETTGRIAVSVYKGAHSDAGSISLIVDAESAKDQKRLKRGDSNGVPKSK